MTQPNRPQRRYVVAQRPRGRVDSETFTLEHSPAVALAAGQARIETLYLSLDPAMRSILDDRPSYVPPVQLGEKMRARGIGRVLESRSLDPRLGVGRLVIGQLGWCDELTVDSFHELTSVEPRDSAGARTLLGALGMTGITAWTGLDLIGKPNPGETIVVTAAAGAVGSMAGQIAKQRGARVVGIAGGQRKCSLLVEQLGFDAAVDYRADDWLDQLEKATPDGIDIDFENVGGPILEAIIDRMNDHGRIVVCGLISTYDHADDHSGPSNFRQLVTKRIRAEGFIVFDHPDRVGPATTEIAAWIDESAILPLETVERGFTRLPEIFRQLFTGRNVGKLLVEVNSW